MRKIKDIKNIKDAGFGFLHEFKAFAIKGNVIDLAVGVVIGAAFGKIVTSLVEEIIMPPLGVVIGNVDFSDYYLILSRPDGAPESFASLKAARDAGVVALGYGNFLNVLLQFIIVAFAIFLVVKQINRLKRAEEVKPTVAPPRQETLLEEIRDILKKK